MQSICLLRLSALGDCINAFGIIGALKQQYPQLEITWVIDNRFAPLFCNEQGMELCHLVKADFKGKGLKAILDIRTQLKGSNNFDALLNMQTSIKASLASLVIKSPLKYGYDSERAREGHSLFINRQVPSPSSAHVIEGFKSFVAQCNLEIDKPVWNFDIDPYLIDRMHSIIGRDKRIFALSPCSAKASKNWHIEGYIALAQYAQEHKMQVVLLGSNSALEIEISEQIAAALGDVVNLCGKTNLRELAAILRCSSLALAPDSGTMHLASALNTPIIGLFACHDEQRVGPWNFMDLNVSVYHKLAKEELKGQDIPWRYRVRRPDAMAQITVDMVKAAFDKAWNNYVNNPNFQAENHLLS